MRSKANSFQNILNSKWFYVYIWLLLIIIGAGVLYLRYPYAFSAPNFYAEDGNVIYENLYNKGFIGALFSRFNGYLIFFQYLVGYASYLTNTVFGGHLYTLPKAVSIVSYITFSVACSLPWLLFKNKLGSIITILTVVLLWFTPFGRSDLAVLGTIGNLKFLFFYVACLLIIYRNDKSLVPNKSKKIYVIDIFLLGCVLTNILVVALLPLALLRYKNILLKIYKYKNIKLLTNNYEILSLFIISLTSIIYVITMYVMGIPKMPGYLDGALRFNGLVNSLFRSSWYGIIYPVYTTMNIITVVGLLSLLPLGLLIKKHRAVYVIVLWGIAISSLGFVLNRPGVTEFFESYTADGGPGQFFYAGTMIFVFGLMYLVHEKFKSVNKFFKLLTVYFFAIYFVWAIPFAGERAQSYKIYSSRPTSYQSIQTACKNSNNTGPVTFKIYPAEGWNMTIKKDIACQGL